CATAARASEPGRPGNHEFPGDFSFLCRSRIDCAGYQSPWFPYCLRRSVVFLGTGGLFTGSRGWIRLGAVGVFLERSRHRYAALFDSNFIADGLIAINHSLRSTRSCPTLEVGAAASASASEEPCWSLAAQL